MKNQIFNKLLSEYKILNELENKQNDNFDLLMEYDLDSLEEILPSDPFQSSLDYIRQKNLINSLLNDLNMSSESSKMFDMFNDFVISVNDENYEKSGIIKKNILEKL